MKKGKSSYEKKIFFGFFAVSVISLIIVAGGAYGIYRNAMKDRLDITMDAIAAQVAYKTDTVIDNMRKYYTEAAVSAELLGLSSKNGEEAFYKELVAPLELLKGPGYLSEFITGFSFINRRQGWILSNRGLYSWEELENREDVESVFQLMEEHSAGAGIWMNQEEGELRKNRRAVEVGGISLAVRVPLMANQPDCVIIVNMDPHALNQLIQDGMGDYGITVLDQNGDLVFGSEEQVSAYCSEHWDKDHGNQMSTPYTIRMENEAGGETELRISQKQSDSSGWRYLVSFDMDPVMEGADGILLLGGVTVGSIGIALALAVIGSKRIYHPVEELVDQAKTIQNSRMDGKNEFTYISAAMDELARERLNLRDIIQGQRRELKNLFFQKLIAGDIPKGEVDARKEELGIVIRGKLMLMASSVRMDRREKEKSAGKDAVLIGIMEYMKQFVGDFLLCDPIWGGNVVFTIICEQETIHQGKSGDNIQERLMRFHQKMGDMIQERYPCTVYSGVSNEVAEIKELPTAYYECLEAVRNNEILKQEAKGQPYDRYDLVFYGEMDVEKAAVLHCDAGYGKAIRDSVDGGDREQAFAVTDTFINDLIQRKIMFHEQQVSLYGYLVEILSVANRAGISANSIFENESSSVFAELGMYHDLEEIREFYKYRVIVPVMESIQSYRSGMVGNVLNRVLELVGAHEGDLTLAECARLLGHHPSYIWKVMTGCMNMTYSEYIQKYKLEEAKKLLRETDSPIVEIAARLHYTSAQNFNRFFTKHESMTPGQYRKMNR